MNLLFPIVLLGRVAAIFTMIFLCSSAQSQDFISQADIHVRTRLGAPIGPIGFGTDGIFSREQLLEAIKVGYRFFDLAEMYKNTSIISDAVMNSGVNREEFFINFKVRTKFGDEYVIQALEETAKLFGGYVDGFMLHDDELEDPKAFIEKISALRGSLFYYFGLSNSFIAPVEDMLEARRREKNLPVEKKDFDFLSHVQMVENHHTHTNPDWLANWRRRGIMHIGYGIFGGKDFGQCGVYIQPEENSPMHFDAIAFPRLHAVAQRLQVSLQHLILAYFSKTSFQIPGTRTKERLKSNFEIVPQIISKLSAHDIKEIEADIVFKNSETLNALMHSPHWMDRLSAHILSEGRQRLLDNLLQDRQLHSMLIFLGQDQAIAAARINKFLLLLEFAGKECGYKTGCAQTTAQKFNEIFQALEQDLNGVFPEIIELFPHKNIDATVQHTLAIVQSIKSFSALECLGCVNAEKFGSDVFVKRRIRFDELQNEMDSLPEQEDAYFDLWIEQDAIELRPCKNNLLIIVDNKYLIVRNFSCSLSIADLKRFIFEKFKNAIESIAVSTNNAIVDEAFDQKNIFNMVCDKDFFVVSVNDHKVHEKLKQLYLGNKALMKKVIDAFIDANSRESAH